MIMILVFHHKSNILMRYLSNKDTDIVHLLRTTKFEVNIGIFCHQAEPDRNIKDSYALPRIEYLLDSFDVNT